MNSIFGYYGWRLPYDVVQSQAKRDNNLLNFLKKKTKKSHVEINLISDSDDEQDDGVELVVVKR